METYEIRTEGMSCNSCERLVQQSITAIEGIARVDPDADAGVVTVEAESGLRGRIEQAIEETGYAVAE